MIGMRFGISAGANASVEDQTLLPPKAKPGISIGVEHGVIGR